MVKNQVSARSALAVQLLDRLADRFAAADDRTRMIFVNSPGNPTGWVMPRTEQQAVLDECRKRGIWLIGDEVYIRLAYESDLPLGQAPSFLDIAEPDRGDKAKRKRGSGDASNDADTDDTAAA